MGLTSFDTIGRLLNRQSVARGTVLCDWRHISYLGEIKTTRLGIQCKTPDGKVWLILTYSRTTLCWNGRADIRKNLETGKELFGESIS